MMRWIFEIAIETGMRVSEITGLTPSQVDLNRRIVRLGDTKNGEPRTVPLTQHAKAIFAVAIGNPARPRDCNLIFAGEPGRDGKGSALDLDVYAWLAQRLHRIEGRPLILHWANLRDQFGQEYTGIEADKNFKKKFLPSLQRVLTVYPEAGVKKLLAASCYRHPHRRYRTSSFTPIAYLSLTLSLSIWMAANTSGLTGGAFCSRTLMRPASNLSSWFISRPMSLSLCVMYIQSLAGSFTPAFGSRIPPGKSNFPKFKHFLPQS